MNSTPASTRHGEAIINLTSPNEVHSPDPDTLYSPSQVPSQVADPVGEVFDHNTNVIRRKIARREAVCVDKLMNSKGHKNKNESPPNQPIPSSAAPTAMPQTLQRLWREVRENEKGDIELDFGMCPEDGCIYCRGPPMAQRYALMQRLSQLEHFLFGVYL